MGTGYDRSFVELVEFIYGEGNLSQGGSESTFSQFEGIDLEGKKLLDIGCGLGGRDMELVKAFDVDVTGIDPEAFLIQMAKERLAQKMMKGRVDFQVTKNPLTLLQFADGSFDVLAARETLLHIPVEKKEAYFKEMFRVLKPGGKITVIDWIRNRPYSETTLKMMEMDGVAFNMIRSEEVKDLLQNAGFKGVQIIDKTEENIADTDYYVRKIENTKDEFIERFGADEYDYSLLSWSHQKRAFENREIQVVKIIADKE